MIVKCKYCNAPIRWITTTKGKKMAVEADSRPFWKVPKGKMRIVTSQGEVFACEYEGEGEADGSGWMPHWANCSKYRK